MAVKTRYIIPPVFVAVAAVAAVFANKCPYCYTYTDLTAQAEHQSDCPSENQGTFGSSTMVAIVVPSGNYDAEGKILSELEELPNVTKAVGLANQEAMDGYMLTDALTPRQFSSWPTWTMRWPRCCILPMR